MRRDAVTAEKGSRGIVQIGRRPVPQHRHVAGDKDFG